MEELKTMEDFSAELEASFRQINPGDIVEGTVIGVSETEITLDLGYYTDGIEDWKTLQTILHFLLKMMWKSARLFLQL